MTPAHGPDRPTRTLIDTGQVTLPPHRHIPTLRHWSRRVGIITGFCTSFALNRLLVDPSASFLFARFVAVTLLAVAVTTAYTVGTWGIAAWATPKCPHRTPPPSAPDGTD